MAFQAVIRNTFLDFTESSGGEPVMARRFASGLQRSASEPTELPGRRGPDEDRANAGQRAAEVEQLGRINRLFQQAAKGPVAAGAGDPLASSFQWPNDDELSALRVQLGQALAAVEQAGVSRQGGPQSSAVLLGSVATGSSKLWQRPPAFTPGASCGSAGFNLSGPCKAPYAELRAQLQDGLSKLLDVEATCQGWRGNAEGRTGRAEERVRERPAQGPTTVMIENIPSRYGPEDLRKELENVGFSGTFDNIYLPICNDGVNNAGHAFVNFVSGAWAKRALDVLQGYIFKKYEGAHSTKVAAVSVAHIQGLAANIEHRDQA